MTGRRCCALLILGLVLVLISVKPAEAVNPETLLMPGKLSAAHVKYEEQCSLCHDRSDRNRQTQLCLDCRGSRVVHAGRRRSPCGSRGTTASGDCDRCGRGTASTALRISHERRSACRA